MQEAMATVDVIQGLHADCDWLLKNFEVRKDSVCVFENDIISSGIFIQYIIHSTGSPHWRD